MTDEDMSIIMCMRTSVDKEPVLGSVKVSCADCGEEIWLSSEMLDGRARPALHDGELKMGNPAKARPVCGPCAVKAADDNGDWATAAHLRHMLMVVEGIEV